jgi:hypothetical protein
MAVSIRDPREDCDFDPDRVAADEVLWRVLKLSQLFPNSLNK